MSYGSKLVIKDRLKKYYLDNDLGEFNIESLINLLPHNLTTTTEQTQIQETNIETPEVDTTVETDSSQSSSTLNNVLIREEDEDEEDLEPQAKKRKVKVNASYFVQRVCQSLNIKSFF